MQKLFILACGIFLSTAAFSQNSPVVKDYIDRYKDIAIEEMIRTGVPAAIKLAQGIHETEAGRSKLCVKSNNHFGIKCKSEWKGEWVSHDDDAKGECFRKYADPADSYRDHSDFLKNRAHYASLFKLDPTDYEGWAYGLKKAGYATNPKYPQLIIKLIKDYNLQQYTLQGIAIAQASKGLPSEKMAEDGVQIMEVMQEGIKEEPVVEEIVATPIAANYPSGRFTINSTAVIFATGGTSYLQIAQQHNIPLARLFDFNDTREKETVSEAGELVFLQRKRTVGDQVFHVVKKGESLHMISQLTGVRLENILVMNELLPTDRVQAGEKIYLQGKAPVRPALITETPVRATMAVQLTQEKYLMHVVGTKETLYAISKKYGVSVDDILKWNNLQGTDLRKGQELKIIR